MFDLGLVIMQLARLATALLIAISLVLIYRWIASRSTVGATIVGLGLLARAVVGLLLFWMSYLNLPVLSHLHSGDGFWILAPDARVYYETAAALADQGLDGLFAPITVGSPAFVRILALWLSGVGTSPISGLLMNLCFYVAACLLLVWHYNPSNEWRQDLPLVFSLGALSFAPALIIHSSQSLKDELFVFLIIGACASSIGFFSPLLQKSTVSGWKTQTAAVIFMALSVMAIAGIRPYFGLMIWLCLAAAFVVFLVVHRSRIGQAIGIAAVTLSVVWGGYWIGGGDLYWNPVRDRSDVSIAEGPIGRLRLAREGFENTGGGTALSIRKGTGPVRPIKALLVGTAALLVPISLLNALSVVELSGGRGLLLITDIDTLFSDVMLVLIVAVLCIRWQTARPRFTYACFAASLGVLTMILMAYVVTNYGTLFRLRLMAAVPFWTLTLALARQNDPAEKHGDGSSVSWRRTA
jgi:hypothetical protein